MDGPDSETVTGGEQIQRRVQNLVARNPQFEIPPNSTGGARHGHLEDARNLRGITQARLRRTRVAGLYAAGRLASWCGRWLDAVPIASMPFNQPRLGMRRSYWLQVLAASRSGVVNPVHFSESRPRRHPAGASTASTACGGSASCAFGHQRKRRPWRCTCRRRCAQPDRGRGPMTAGPGWVLPMREKASA